MGFLSFIQIKRIRFHCFYEELDFLHSTPYYFYIESSFLITKLLGAVFMREYQNKTELINAIKEHYQKYITEFDSISEEFKNKRIIEVEQTPSENLSYQIGWVTLLLQWEKDEQQGKIVQTPTEKYKWNNLGGLNQSFYQEYGHYSLAKQKALLTQLVEELCHWVESLSDTELFESEQRNWATTKAKWPIWKWVHINTVAPFTNFRTKIRKWKKLNN